MKIKLLIPIVNVFIKETNTNLMLSRIKSLNIWIKVAIILVTIIGAGVGWWLISPLFIEGETLNEQLPDNDNTTLLYNGTFVRIDNTHWGIGTVEIIRTSDGKTQLLFRDVEISNGPSLVVYLSKKATFSGTGDTPGSFKNLGDLPGQKGNFSMDIVGVTNLDEYKSVLIWCEPFKVVFTFATLSSVS